VFVVVFVIVVIVVIAVVVVRSWTGDRGPGFVGGVRFG
jgi:hypothetical protein